MKKSISPKLIHEFNKNASEVVRVQLTEYDGKELLDIRVWVTRDEKNWIPTKKEVSIRIEQIEDLKQGIDKAVKEIEKGE